ncbi:MAG: ribonuclease R [Bacilli bacterium]|nr:ribonuclease R [Bacilli bacterium]
MRKDILNLFKEEKKALSINEIAKLLDIKDDKFDELNTIIKQLEEELQIKKTKKKKYCLEQKEFLVGTFLSKKKEYGHVQVEGLEEDIYIPSKYTLNAMDKDKVVIELANNNPSKKGIGRVVKVVEHAKNTIVGQVVIIDGNCYVIPDNKNLNITIRLEEKDLIEGYKVLVKLKDVYKLKIFNGEIERVLGHKDDPGVDIEAILNEYGIRYVFSSEIEEELKDIPLSVSSKDLINREDLRGEDIYTIDDITTKDRDDAILVKRLINGNYLLSVSIADVGYYVKEGSKIDEEARKRGNSVYLKNTSVPMLPRKLSNGICSLNENVDRLTKTCDMEINQRGEVVAYKIYNSVINSRKEMTYQNVNKILEEKIIPNGYEKFKEQLELAEELAEVLRNRKIKKGLQDFDLPEAKIIVDENGKTINVEKRERGQAERLIEMFMITANETVAEYQERVNCPTSYRVHDEPNKEKLKKFIDTMKLLGNKLDVRIDNIYPSTIQKILEDLKDKENGDLARELVLRSMSRAKYSANNYGHFGLASDYYCHFTSPIRRYSDLTVHRTLSKIEEGKIYTDNEYMEWLKEEVRNISITCSNTEVTADECERAAEKMAKAEYMEQHIGEEFEGVINGITSKGMFVRLENTIEGFVRGDSNEGDFLVYDPNTLSMVGRTSKRKYKFGDKTSVVVKSADKEARIIDFTIPNPEKQKKLIK